MQEELMLIDASQIVYKPCDITFGGFDNLLEQSKKLAYEIQNVEVNEENIKQSKKLLAAVNKRLKELDDKRISIKKEVLVPYNTFESQVKEIVSIVKEADNIVRVQVRELEEKERELKKLEIESLFDKRISSFKYSELFTFDDFFKQSYTNKTTSMNQIELEMVDWFEKIENDVSVISTLPNSTKILAQYKLTGDLALSIKYVNEREMIENVVKKVVEKQSSQFIITLTDEKDLKLVEMFMKEQQIKYNLEKVGN